MDLQLGGKAALVTGSSKGIGEAIAMTLAREGATVVVHGRDEDQTRRVVGSIVASGGRAHAVLGDLTEEDAVERLVAEAQDRAGAIDILVNNAGGSGEKTSWDETQSAGWAGTYDRNVLAAVRVSTRLLPDMRKAGWGRVINVSSAAATMPPAAGPDYSAAKAVAADGVTVNAISPGTIRSARLESGFRGVAATRGTVAQDAPWEAIQRDVLPLFAIVPLGRVGELDELADTVAFLSSPLAGYITGINLHVDGGFSCIP
jgi:3-oxoacyl-[acyl-carrier protein] reductase